ncbi:hypothetical protein JAAARDRAFT_27587 [Jaapia argillacea MUCL 33604]|uniref:Calcineurin-like phosphoesterase domain-containing protein n=1 Tax=Jaapia argillacea MUCL 33604 TaxID=933084 RepID=A0A067QCS3_9AGAM|nr:hypothetical protein JAAARDRAFT_27587 [Jaapia argillacea MUCL 33604]
MFRSFRSKASKPVNSSPPPVVTELPSLPSTLTSPSAIAHLEYDPSNPPPIPGPNWTRFVCISDTHCHQFPVPNGDVLLHSGDLTATGRVEEFKVTMEWLYGLPHATKIIIGGNHDLPLHRGWYETHFQNWHWQGPEKYEPILKMIKGDKAKKANLVYLEDEKFEFRAKEGGRVWSVYGSPWSPWYGEWAFNYRRDTAEELVAKFPKTDILLTHGPPHGILDMTMGGEEAGCEALTARLPTLRPRLHLFGHIHEGHGAEIRSWPSTTTPSLPIPEPQTEPGSEAQPSTSAVPSEAPDEERTVFVNAANWPMGERMMIARSVGRSEFGGLGFRPIIVDLLDEV